MLPTTYRVAPHGIDQQLTDALVRRLNLEIARCGIATSDQAEWTKTSCWWPSLIYQPEVLAIQDALESLVDRTPNEEWSGPQIVLRFPSESKADNAQAHIDEPPIGYRNRVICGVALSDYELRVWPQYTPELVQLNPGDVVMMEGGLPHAATLNRRPWVMYAAYFRVVAPKSIAS